MFSDSNLILVILTSTILSISCSEKPAEVIKTVAETANSYSEPHRPQYHFSPPANWMNDPNGMFYYQGKYHLFYQYYPDSIVWGPMHWAHAESEDMVYWKHLPTALYPDTLGYIFSGGAVVDHKNTSQFGTADNPPIVATFTHHDIDGERAGTTDFQYQSIAYSTDGGTNWTKYKNNPVVPNTEKIKDFRDPKVVWHEKSKKWIMVLAAYDKAKFYASPDLIDWTFISDFGIEKDKRLWECPDLFPIKVEGTDEEKWVLIVSIQKEAPNGGTASSYFVGDFDGKKFISDPSNQKWLDWGTDNYAFVTWDNAPDNRKLGIGWMSNWQYAQIVPTEKWRSAMTLPRELKLQKTNADYLLTSTPVKELQKLRDKTKDLGAVTIEDKLVIDAAFSQSQCEVVMSVASKKTTASSFSIELSNDLRENVTITFDRKNGKLLVDRRNSSKNKFSKDFYKEIHSAPLDFGREEMKIQLFVDASSIDLFVNDGELCFTDIFFPTEQYNKMSFSTTEGTLELSDADIYTLKSIWN